MRKIKERVTILAVGDRADHDSFRKFHKERLFILHSGFDYKKASYSTILAKGAPTINTKRVIVFLFFPFVYWNKYIEHKNYRGLYGNHRFYDKFAAFWDKVGDSIKDSLKDKEVFFVNNPFLCTFCRDKLKVIRKLSSAGVKGPKAYNITSVKKIENLLNNGQPLFIKPRFGSMGKGITFLSWSNWQTNFIYKNDEIISRRSDKGWKFRDITGNKNFLRKLLHKDIMIEKAISTILVKQMKVDLRMYVFFNKVLYIYPRKNRLDRITTNITQGAKGDPSILGKLPRRLVDKAKKMAERASRVLGLNLTGIDIMIDRNLKDVYVLDVNVFPGLPKRKTFRISQYMIKKLKRLAKKGKLHFEKGSSI